jgi:hypothetical protein
MVRVHPALPNIWTSGQHRWLTSFGWYRNGDDHNRYVYPGDYCIVKDNT